MFRPFVLLICAAALGGCTAGANVEKDFKCAAQSGKPCRSLSEVDGSAGAASSSLKEDARDTQNKSLTQDPIFAGKKNAATAALPAGGFAYQSARYRIAEKTGKIWIAPYLDEANILHEGTNVHVVLREARWGTK